MTSTGKDRFSLLDYLAIAGAFATITAALVHISSTLANKLDLLVIAFAILGALVFGLMSTYFVRIIRMVLPHAQRVVLSYSHGDAETALEITKALRRRGIKVWIDTEQLFPGGGI